MRVKGIPLLRVAKEMRPVLFSAIGIWGAALLARRLGYTRRVFVAAHAMELRKNLLPGPWPHYTSMSIVERMDFPVSRFTGNSWGRGVREERYMWFPTELKWSALIPGSERWPPAIR